MSIGEGEEEKGEVDTAETVQRRVQSPGGSGRPQRTHNGQRTRSYLRGASDPDGAWDTAPPKGDARDFLGTPGQAGAGPGGAASSVRPTPRATPSGVGLDEKKAGRVS